MRLCGTCSGQRVPVNGVHACRECDLVALWPSQRPELYDWAQDEGYTG